MKVTTQYIFVSATSDKPRTFASSIVHEDDFTNEDILESIFSACNRGSRREDPLFLESRIPSLSVGDQVVLVDKKLRYECKSVGWQRVED